MYVVYKYVQEILNGTFNWELQGYILQNFYFLIPLTLSYIQQYFRRWIHTCKCRLQHYVIYNQCVVRYMFVLDVNKTDTKLHLCFIARNILKKKTHRYS